LNLLPLAQLGAIAQTANPNMVDFGVLLPGIAPPVKTLHVRIINAKNQFVQGAQVQRSQRMPRRSAHVPEPTTAIRSA